MNLDYSLCFQKRDPILHYEDPSSGNDMTLTKTLTQRVTVTLQMLVKGADEVTKIEAWHDYIIFKCSLITVK